MNNIFRCYVCGRHVIAEELDQHKCRSKNYKIVDNTLQVFDGKVWYPLKLDHAYPTFFDRENFRRRLDRTIKQQPYKVQVPYLTVW